MMSKSLEIDDKIPILTLFLYIQIYVSFVPKPSWFGPSAPRGPGVFTPVEKMRSTNNQLFAILKIGNWSYEHSPSVLASDRSRTGIDPRSDRNIGYRLISSLDLISNHINRSIRLIKWPISIRFGAFIPKLSVGSSCNLQIRSVSRAALISLRFSSNPWQM